MRLSYKSIILALSSVFALSASISAAPGDLDSTFGSGGVAIMSITDLPFYDFPRSIQVQPDGKLIVCGEVREDDLDGNSTVVSVFLARLHPNGTPDTSFGTNGKVVAPVTSGGEIVGEEIALQSDGKIVAVGQYSGSGSAFAVNRYNSDGTLDASFGTGGKVVTRIGIGSYARSVTVQPDGKIVVVGSASLDPFTGGFAVARYNPNGSLDASFGEGGKITAPVSGVALAVMLQPDGKIITAGMSVDNGRSYPHVFALVRFNADGSLDSGFGAGGKVVQTFPNADAFLTDAVLQTDGRIVVTGHLFSLNPPTLAIARYNANGSVDTSFAANGIFTSPITSFMGDGIALQPDGKIVSFGRVPFAVSAALRLNPNGSPDTGFGPNGLATTPYGSSYGLAGAVQPNGRILFVGYTWIGGDIIIARFLGDATACPNPIDCNELFVRQHYLDFLGREPDPPGLAFWTNEITACGNDAGCREAKRVNVSAAFFLSIEFQESGYLVYRAHRAAFGNLPGRPVPVVRDSFLPEARGIAAGVIVGADGWQGRLEGNKNAYMLGFVQRPAFISLYPRGVTAAEFVDALDARAGGVLDDVERDALVGELQADNTDAGRASVLRKMAEDGTLDRREFNRAFVFMQYAGYLSRDPDAPGLFGPDPNFDGFNFWLDKLTQFNGDFVRAEMVKAFLDSIEYRRRFGQP